MTIEIKTERMDDGWQNFLETREAFSIVPGTWWGHTYLVYWDDSEPFEQAARGVGGTKDISGELAVYSQFLLDSPDAYGPDDTSELRNRTDITTDLQGSVNIDPWLIWLALSSVANGLNGEYEYDVPSVVGDVEAISNSNAAIFTVLSNFGFDMRSLWSAP